MCDHDHPWTFQNEKHKTDIENSYQGNPGFKISNADISFDNYKPVIKEEKRNEELGNHFNAGIKPSDHKEHEVVTIDSSDEDFHVVVCANHSSPST